MAIVHTVFVNPDKDTGFGTPWEVLYEGNYTIRTKGGNVDGYSALFSFIPQLHLGKSTNVITCTYLYSTGAYCNLQV